MPSAPASAAFQLQPGPTYSRLCDASGASFLEADTFVAASDEAQSPTGENRLQIYRVGTPEPIAHLDLNAYLGVVGPETEADIESAARIGDVVYWISSHGRDSEGKERLNRQRFFATQFKKGRLETVGVAYTQLLQDLTEHDAEIKSAYKAKLAPEEGGISIEGLCQGVGDTLLIGFRSPLAYSRALCCEISNPADVLRGSPPKLSDFWTLNVGKRGIRDWTKWGEKWLILAGSARDEDVFALYQWDGDKDGDPLFLGDLTQALKAIGMAGMNPEALAVAENGDIWLMADDGGVTFPGEKKKNKKLPEAKRRFRSVRVILG